MQSRRLLAGAAATAAVLVTGVLSSPVGAQADNATSTPSGKATDYTVLVEAGASQADAVQAVKAAGGKVLRSNDAVGLLAVRAPSKGFVLAVSESDAVVGASKVQTIGHTPDAKVVKDDVETEGSRATDRGIGLVEDARAPPPPGWTPWTASCGGCGWCGRTAPAPCRPATRA